MNHKRKCSTPTITRNTGPDCPCTITRSNQNHGFSFLQCYTDIYVLYWWRSVSPPVGANQLMQLMEKLWKGILILSLFPFGSLKTPDMLVSFHSLHFLLECHDVSMLCEVHHKAGSNSLPLDGLGYSQQPVNPSQNFYQWVPAVL